MTLEDKIIRPKWQCFVKENDRTVEYVIDQHAKKVYQPTNLHGYVNPFRRDAEFKLVSTDPNIYSRIWRSSWAIYTHNNQRKRIPYKVKEAELVE